MHLIYLDESGNSGRNLNDPQQPVFVLCALIVQENQWQPLESALRSAVEKHWTKTRPVDFEIHAAELINPKTEFVRVVQPSARLAFMEEWISIARQREVKLVFRAIVKDRYSRWLNSRFGAGVFINPHVVALALLSQVINSHLKKIPGSPLGMFISDENHSVARDVDKAIELLRGADGSVRLTQIIEKGFFIQSHKSLVLQLCDLSAYIIRRHEEIRRGGKAKTVDEILWKQIEPLVTVGDERFTDTIDWLESQQKKERPGA